MPTDRNRAADLRLRREYGITLQEYNLVLCHQNNVCFICGEPPKRTRLSVDHDHTTGEVRGLLCWSCNRAIAVFKDNSKRLSRAAVYLINPPFAACLGRRYTAPGRVGTKKRAKLLLKFK